MFPACDPGALEEIKQEVETFIQSAGHLAVLDSGEILLELGGHEWELSIQFGKLVFEVWNATHSYAWRVDEVASREKGRLGLLVHRPGAQRVSTLELQDESPQGPATQTRLTFKQDLVTFLRSRFPEWRLERISNRSDRERTFSAWFTRGLARRGRNGWAFLGLGEAELPAAADAALAYGLNWLTWLREREASCVISGLKLFLPPQAVTLTAHRAVYVDSKAALIEIFEWPCRSESPSPIDLRDFGNIETRLTQRRSAELWIQRHQAFLHSIFGEAAGRVHLAPEASGNGLSVRILGLDIARLHGDIAPHLNWGIEGERREYRPGHEDEIQDFLATVLKVRRPRSETPDHPLFRLYPERWLESLLIRDVTLLDPALNPEHVYPQVPAFSGNDRGVVDILSVRRDGRLAVIELKLHEEITLPMQGLDYWLRVKWLNDRAQFQKFGYFQGIELAPAPPLLYLVSPAFRFHSTTPKIIRYLSPSVEVIQVGVNQTWRDGVKILFRRTVHP